MYQARRQNVSVQAWLETSFTQRRFCRMRMMTMSGDIEREISLEVMEINQDSCWLPDTESIWVRGKERLHMMFPEKEWVRLLWMGHEKTRETERKRERERDASPLDFVWLLPQVWSSSAFHSVTIHQSNSWYHSSSESYKKRWKTLHPSFESHDADDRHRTLSFPLIIIYKSPFFSTLNHSWSSDPRLGCS